LLNQKNSRPDHKGKRSRRRGEGIKLVIQGQTKSVEDQSGVTQKTPCKPYCHKMAPRIARSKREKRNGDERLKSKRGNVCTNLGVVGKLTANR